MDFWYLISKGTQNESTAYSKRTYEIEFVKFPGKRMYINNALFENKILAYARYNLSNIINLCTKNQKLSFEFCEQIWRLLLDAQKTTFSVECCIFTSFLQENFLY